MRDLFQNWKALALVLVFLLVVFLIFRSQIADVLARSNDVKVGPGGLEVVATPIGEITSGKPLQESTNQTTNKQAGAQDCPQRTFCSPAYGFLISWPNDSWKVGQDLPPSRHKDYTLPDEMDVPVYMNKIVGSNKSLAVSVGVGPVKPGMDINTWIDGVTKGLPAGTVDKSVDPQTNSGVVVVVGSDGLTNVKKYFIIGNQLYAVGTNRFDDAAVSEQDKNEATDIINSFRLLRK